MSGPRNVFSVDLEDWYQGIDIDMDHWGGFESRIEIGTYRVLELLEEAGVRATFFVLGYQAEQTPKLIAEIAAAGHEMASHGYSHRFVYRQTPAQFRTELRRAKAAVEDASGQEVTGYRAPYFSITHESLWALDILAEEGFRYDSSMYPVMHYRYGIIKAKRSAGLMGTPDGRELFEAPLSTLRVPPGRYGVNVPLAGGGYFRLYPYALTRTLARRLRARGTGLVFYVHPWEYDPDHPRIEVPGRFPRFTHYVNLATMHPKTRRLLADFDFESMEAVYGPQIEQVGE